MNTTFTNIIVAAIFFASANCLTSNVCRQNLSNWLFQEGIQHLTEWALKEPEQNGSHQQSEPETIRTPLAKWQISNASRRDISLRFFSGQKVWPSMKSAYTLRRGDSDSYVIACFPDDEVCFAAWRRQEPQIYWGAGYFGDRKCTDCCVRCSDMNKATVSLTD